MSENVKGLTRRGEHWIPEFIVALDSSKCIGCGRCYKVCPRDVFELADRAEVLALDSDDDDEDDDEMMMVMTMKDELDCIGCRACSKVCPRNCHTHIAAPTVAAS